MAVVTGLFEELSTTVLVGTKKRHSCDLLIPPFLIFTPDQLLSHYSSSS
jgi:hypothetical protein